MLSYSKAAMLFIVCACGLGAVGQEVSFLKGKKSIGKPHDVVDNLGGGPTMVDKAFTFAGDFQRLVKIADAELLPKGWKKSIYRESWMFDGPKNLRSAFFYDPKGYQRTVGIYEHCGKPPFLAASDLIVVGEFRKGWVGVTISRLKRLSDRGRKGKWSIAGK